MKHGFQQEFINVRTSDGHNFTLLEDLVFVTKIGAVLTVRAGASTDGRSTPKELWAILPPFGKGWKSAILHDDLYRRTRMAKTNCDDLYYEALISEGVSELEARACLEGLRRWGQEAFDENRRKLDAAQTAADA